MLDRLRGLGRIPGYGALVLTMGLYGVAIALSAPYWVLYFTVVVGYSVTAAGLLMASGTLAGVLASAFVARRTDRLPARRLLIAVAALALAARYVAYVTVHSYLPLFAVSMILSAGAGPGMPQIFAAGRDAVAQGGSGSSAFALSTLRSLFSLGFVVGPALGAVVLVATGYRGVLLGSAALLVLVAAIVLVKPKRPAETAAAQATQTTRSSAPPSAPAPLGARPRVAILAPFAAFVVLALANWVNGFNLPLFVVHALGDPARDVGIVTSVCAALEIPLMIGLGAVASRFSTRAVVVYGCLIGAFGYAVIAMSTSLRAVVGAQLFQAAFIAVLMGVGVGYFQDLLPDSAGVAATLYSNSLSVGQVLGIVTGSVVAEAAGYRGVYWVCVGMVAAGFAILGASEARTRAARPMAGEGAGAPSPP